MAKAQPNLGGTLYRTYLCGDDVGEADAFFEIKEGKLKLVTCWSHNDAMWRDEYMSGLISYFGGKIEKLPSKHEKEAEKLVAKAWGLD